MLIYILLQSLVKHASFANALIRLLVENLFNMMKLVFFRIFISCLLVWTRCIENVLPLALVLAFDVMVYNKFVAFSVYLSNNLILLMILASKARSVKIWWIDEILRVINLIYSFVRCLRNFFILWLNQILFYFTLKHSKKLD